MQPIIYKISGPRGSIYNQLYCKKFAHFISHELIKSGPALGKGKVCFPNFLMTDNWDGILTVLTKLFCYDELCV